MGLLVYCLGKELIFVKNSNPPIKVGTIHTVINVLYFNISSKPMQNLVRFVQPLESGSVSVRSKPMQNLVRFVPLQWNRKRQYAGCKTASDRKQKTSAVPLL